ncbi:HAMP domain-containing histidine kinase [Hymenobacter busanensis]|uniref:histidine kinase n=1 Tax=Hymenobacter busanensis TaxID=2607656 RepID=A0A7L4ZT65_9BACT|nr:HAMP domain-containing sensor histidine kinase [Hymenobacter busanensis]KAA9327675.1 HAMP domain-containing histidine kinase [Hymenobacter busanensis]QHJ05985.1 sensor histidine kinase [Hymenobacter busanensis]
MKRRIRSIFWLMALCILGINGFQAYWLYNTYQLSTTQFQRTAREALQSVVQQYQLAAARQFIRGSGPEKVVIFQSFSQDGDALDRVIVQNHNGAKPDSTRQLRRVALQRELLTRLPQRRPADTLARHLSRLLIGDWKSSQQVNLPRLQQAYRAELDLRGIPTAFVLDTLRIPIAERSRAALLEPQSARLAAVDFRTAPVALNPINYLYVQAGFATPAFYILRQMGGLLGGSVLLLALTTGCFVLMLSTILKQKKLSEVKNDFINNMTHELKTPLATVSAAVEAMQHFGVLQDAQKTQTYLSISRHELQRLSDLVERVLNIAVEERQTLTLNPELVRPAELVDELVARHQLKAAKPVQFTVDISPADAVRLDRTHVSGVINNLIDNAIKYSREQVSIAIRGRREASGWRLTVQDDGIGIPSSYQEAIFDRFFRVPTGNLHPVKGFGLGLYYVRQVVERHGGTIDVRSSPNQGSEFSMWLPG